MRRGVGLKSVDKKRLEQAKYRDKGTVIAGEDLSNMSKQLEAFQTNLGEFAAKHSAQIRRNPEFRAQFQNMCAQVGVDPLASSKGFWAEMLGVGDFYYELGVQIVEICLATRPQNGGLIGLDELRVKLTKTRSKSLQDISNDDIMRSIKKLRVLGSGFTVIPLGGGHCLIQSVPGELNMDHTTVLQLAEVAAFTTVSEILTQLKWNSTRAQQCLDFMVKEGLAWVDDQQSNERKFWFPSFFPDS